MNEHVVKTVPVTMGMVVAAYEKVRQGGKAAGIDKESWQDFEAKGAEKQLYVIWNRMASGSYFPQAVREVEIPKKDGKTRKLGIPTIRDRIAQQVVKEYMEQRIDYKFHPNSYGYRPLKSAQQAIEQVRKNCLEQDWVLDMDISKFFDEIAHELMLKAVETVFTEKWIKTYVQRWLQMQVVKADGTVQDRGGKGTPQGGVISPLLANLFLHFGLDMWLSKHYPGVRFVRYADDVIVHCQSEADAQQMLQAIKQRMEQIGLKLNEEKTKIVYCKDYRRRQNHSEVQFGFLGYSYQPRAAQSKYGKDKSFTVFTPEISKENQKRIRDNICETVNWRDTTQQIDEIAEKLNNKLRGWLNYYGLYGKRQLHKIMFYLETKLLKWWTRKHRAGIRKSLQQLNALKRQQPYLFHHWWKEYCKNYQRVTRAV